MAEPGPKVLFVDHTAMLGGAELCLLDVAAHFRHASRVVLLADGPLRDRLDSAGVHVTVLRGAGWLHRISRQGGLLRDLMAVPEVVRLALALAIRSRSFDLLYANSLKSMVIAGMAGRIAHRPVIWHLHDFMAGEHFGLPHLQAARLGGWLATRVLGNSDATGRAYLARGGAPAKLRVVHNGFHADAFAPVPAPELAALRDSLGLGPGPVVGVFSRLAAWKGQHVLLQALEALPGVQALLVGDALFDGDLAYAASLRAMARRCGGHVHLLGFRTDIPHLLRLCDVVALTSVAPEPFGRVVVEAMLAECPVVATTGGGTAEIIEPGRTGLLVPPDDPAALATAIRCLLDDRPAAAAIAARARNVAAERFSLQTTLDMLERQVAEVAGAGRVSMPKAAGAAGPVE